MGGGQENSSMGIEELSHDMLRLQFQFCGAFSFYKNDNVGVFHKNTKDFLLRFSMLLHFS